VKYYRRNLPHYELENATYFLTFRLAASLPKNVIAQIKDERVTNEKLILSIEDLLKRNQKLVEFRKTRFGRIDRLLDQNTTGPAWLEDFRIAQIVADAICYRGGKEYDLISYCIMPNHVHLVIHVERNDISLYKILQSLKRFTARECNKILRRSGSFWQHESYDHVVRSQEELVRIVNYVIYNPVKAGLVNEWTSWKWTYSKFEL